MMGLFAWSTQEATAADSHNEIETLHNGNPGTSSYGATTPSKTETVVSGESAADNGNDSNGHVHVQPLSSTPSVSSSLSWSQRLYAVYKSQLFVLRIAAAIVLAHVYPPLGAIYLLPQVTASWIAVWTIFALAGLGLPTHEFARACQRWYFNLFVQVFNFVGVSVIVFGVSSSLHHAGWINNDLADGMVICSCLPMAINMVIVMTKAANGDEAAAVFHVIVSNMAGILISPALITAYLHVHGTMQLHVVFTEMSLRVLLPIAVGQTWRNLVPGARDLGQLYAVQFKAAQEWCLIFIVYTVFCETFQNGTGSNNSTRHMVTMICFQALLLSGISLLAWHMLGILFPNEPRLRVMGLFGCTQKTIAAGIPIVAAMYSNNPVVGTYTLPLLIWHPLQLLIGSSLAPWLARYVEREEKRLNLRESENFEDTLLILT